MQSISALHKNTAPGAPWQGLYWLAFTGLFVRIIFALHTENIHHPDEVFQYLEQAHRLVFGYGFIPWEYRFGTRSWLIPFFISGPLYLCKILHLDEPFIYIPVVKSVFCLVSTSLIFSSYVIGRNLVSEKAGRLAALFCCFWYELLYFSFRPLADVFSAYFLIAALACLVVRPEHRRPILFGFLSAVTLAMRIQYLPLVLFLVMLAAFTWKKNQIIQSGVVFMGVLLLSGYIDYLTWGKWFVSYYNNILFNHIYGISSSIFLTQPALWYPEQLLIASSGIFMLCLLLSCFFFQKLWVLVASILILVITHSFLPHKEYRFIFAAIPLLLMITAAVISLYAERSAKTQRWRYGAAITVFFLVSVGGGLNRLPYEQRIYHFTPLYARENTLQAFDFMRADNKLAALFINSPEWWLTGGYYYLHRDVPVYFLYQHFGSIHEAKDHVSHVLCEPISGCVRDFAPAARMGGLEVCKRRTPFAIYPQLSHYDRQIYQPGIDGVYKPTVQPLF
ncbi:MAG: hypothetical protein NTW08_04880 [Gammaproteobacteria bacterium]|nr:hypothetical protein [Gammaproteobacteria bacterium]